MRPLLAIDPGLNSLGYAYWSADQTDEQPPQTVGLLHAPRKLDLPTRSRWLGKQLNEMTLAASTKNQIAGNRVTLLECVSEYPAFFGGQSVRGWAKGDLQKLCFLVGVLVGTFRWCPFKIVTPGEWKGQLPKDVVIRRLQNKFGPGATQEWEKDSWDAVGIGLWKLGRF